MDIDDFFEKKHKPYNHHYKNRQEHEADHEGYRHSHDGHEYHGSNRHAQNHGFDWHAMLTKINSNPMLRRAAIAVALVAVLLIILLIIVLIPVLSTLWETFTGSGLQGLLDKLLKG